MAIVAVAGGTGDVGRTIVEALLETGKHTVFVLGRKASTTSGPNDVKSLVVDYNNIDGLTKVLDDNSIDTIISAIQMEGPGVQAQANLIVAAGKSSKAKRFIPSEYSGFAPDEAEDVAGDEFTAAQKDAIKAVKKAGLTYTRFVNGLFMDYFGQPHVPSHLRPFKWVFDMATRRVAIPGTGDELITMTYSKDMARFVARLVEEDEWPEYSLVSGSDASLNQVVALIEKALGSKLDVARDSAEDLKAGKVTDLFGGEEMYGGLDTATTAIFLGLAVVEGKALLPKEGRLNDRFPNIKVKSIEELTAEAWIGK
ncbi:hypothetical protein B0T11DRAFT_335849 [Plectosphaerella cucumerina]|uniref:NmrA-like domain-containing protein n=1 Tax=Plectosphaerella cucumerina TaxID=40658 RepID=A0A8K0TQW2_9PEZI|nr:hypothetical protein B0T11DRAFT_335849 [Plectosphaerella cucumerina]